MIDFKKAVQNFKGLNYKNKFYIYLFLGLSLSSVILFSSSYHVNKGYDLAAGLSYKLGNDSHYCTATFAQGVIGEDLKISMAFQEFNSDLTFYILLIQGGKQETRLNFSDKLQSQIIPNLNDDNLANYSVFVKRVNISGNTSNSLRILIPFPQNNAYTLVYLLSNKTQINSSTDFQFTADYRIIGSDYLLVILSIILFLFGLSFLILFLISYDNDGNRHKTNVKFRQIKNSATSENIKDENTLTLTLIKNETNNFIYKDKITLFDQIKSLFIYELKLVYTSPLIIIFILFIVIFSQNILNGTYNYWLIQGENPFQDLGPSVTSDGIILYSFYIFLFSVVILLFSFREFDENIYILHICFARERKWYLLIKYIVSLSPLLIFWSFFELFTFVIIPLRNPTFGFVNFNQFVIVSFSYLLLTLFLGLFPFFLVILFMNSRIATILWVIFYLFWNGWSSALINNIKYSNPSLANNFETNFTLGNLERVFEFLIERPLYPNLKSGYFIYIHDTLNNSILILGIYLIAIFLFLFLSVSIFRRVDV